MNKLIFAALLLGLNAYSARVAVTDSGTDFSHDWLAGRALVNTGEIAGNRIDDDKNGKVDDIVGWNFADNYGRVFFKEHAKDVNPKVFKVIEILSRVETNTQTEEDKNYFETEVKKLPAPEKQKLVAELNAYGQYAHSTHVSGIIASVSPSSKMISNRTFPDAPLNFVNPMAAAAKEKAGITDFLYRMIATATNGTFDKVSAYLVERKIDVANYSLGMGLKNIAMLSLTVRGNKKPTEAQILQEMAKIYAQFEPIGQRWMKVASNTLFVVAAGNDGTDNDKLPAFPANVRSPNRISVGASMGVVGIAKFSNYGVTSVDVMAPGVAIKSSVPAVDNKMVLPMSGTSMAAPYVAGVAANMKDINPALTPAQLREILMGTVDKKPWLKDKAVSGGVVNAERAYAASEKSKTMSIDLAVQASLQLVQDQIENSIPKRLQAFSPIVSEMREFSKNVIF